jgi:hypothetical protein
VRRARKRRPLGRSRRSLGAELRPEAPIMLVLLQGEDIPVAPVIAHPLPSWYPRRQSQNPNTAPESVDRPLPNVVTLVHEVKRASAPPRPGKRLPLPRNRGDRRSGWPRSGQEDRSREVRRILAGRGRGPQLVKRDGRDLTPDEQKKESDRIDKRSRATRHGAPRHKPRAERSADTGHRSNCRHQGLTP